MQIWEIVKVVEEQPVKVIHSDLDLDVDFETPDGWRYQVFFDCDEPDYLNWIESPDGLVFKFWKSTDERETVALGYLAGNLLHMADVSERLKAALVTFKSGDQDGR